MCLCFGTDIDETHRWLIGNVDVDTHPRRVAY